MGWFREFISGGAGLSITTDPAGAIRSPWTTAQLHRIVLADLAGVTPSAVTRAQAMRVPAVVKGRALIAGTLARLPLAVYAGDVLEEPAPWMYRTNTGTAPSLRMLWTLDDLIFHGLSLWGCTRGPDDTVADAVRIPPNLWRVNPDTLGVELIGDRNVSRDQLVLFEGPQEGLLDLAQDTIPAALAMTTAWAKRVSSPVPMVELHSTDQAGDLEQDEATALVADWETARAEGGTAYTPSSVELRVHGQTVADLFVQGRNALRLDLANYLHLPAALLEGSTATASLTYVTTEGKRSEFIDYSLGYWAEPIEARLSQDDVVPAGRRAAFDLSSMVTTDTPPGGPTKED